MQGKNTVGSEVVTASGFDVEGFVTAYDMSTGKIKWQDKFPGESCYSGAVTTAGGLVFVGHNDGDLVAYDIANRQRTLELPDRRRRQHDRDGLRRRRRRESRDLRRW